MAQQEELRTLLQALTLARSWTYRDAAKEYRRIGRLLGEELDDNDYRTADVAEATWRRWTWGSVRRVPNSPAPAILERMFPGHPVTQLLAPPPAAADTLQPALNESDIAMTARDAAAHAGNAASAQLPEMTLDQIDDDVRALAVAYETTDPRAAFHGCRTLLTDVQNKLERTQRPRQKERLYLAAGMLSSLMSVAAFDLATLGPAIQFARTSAMYGETIEYGPLQAYANGVLAFLSYWGGQPTTALRYIQTAKRFGGVGDMGQVRLHAIEARAHAHLGRPREAERAIQAALEPGRGLHDDLHDVGGEFSFGPARAAMSHATTYLVLGDSERAEASAEHALNLLQAEASPDRPVQMQVTVDLARARLLREELDGVDEALGPVFSTAAEWRTIGLVDRLAQFRGQLVGSPAAQAHLALELGEQIEDFVALAAARPLPGSRAAIES
jgi:tetratricopeptide (TPR) repeat protein